MPGDGPYDVTQEWAPENHQLYSRETFYGMFLQNTIGGQNGRRPATTAGVTYRQFIPLFVYVTNWGSFFGQTPRPIRGRICGLRDINLFSSSSSSSSSSLSFSSFVLFVEWTLFLGTELPCNSLILHLACKLYNRHMLITQSVIKHDITSETGIEFSASYEVEE